MAFPNSILVALLSLALVSQCLSDHLHTQASNPHSHHQHDHPLSIKCLEVERQALLQFKRALSDPGDRLSSWTGDDCCSWVGVACNNVTGHVVKLDLRNPPTFIWYDDYYYDTSFDLNMTLGGKLDPSLVNLKQLHFLDLSCNDFYGIRIPEFMGSFKKLEYLNLSHAGFTGTIPHHLGNLSTLKSLDLSYNGYPKLIIGNNAHWLSGLTSLKYLDLSEVDMSQASNWLHALNMLPSLLEIRLFLCNLPHSSPSLNLPYLNFTSLSTLDLSDNGINSTLPDWLFNLTSLEYLSLSGNDFEGKIPSTIGSLTSLKALDLSDSFDGDHLLQIPTTLANLCNLHTLDLSYLNLDLHATELGRIFSGCIKHSLVELHLSNTSLQGPLPDWVGNLTNLKVLDLSQNNINSTLPPTWLYNLSRLEYLNLKYNSLHGPIPANIDQLMSSLKILVLSYNQGLSLPTSLGNLCKLQSLSLSGLDLGKETAKIQQIFSGCLVHSLKVLQLADTNMQGDMPYWIDGLKNLQLLDLSHNKINSTLPHWLFNLTTISYLDLSSNDFQGSIPPIIENMTSLVVLSLDFNYHLEGPIPMTLGNLCKLRILELTGVNISQNFHEFGSIFSGCIRNSLIGLELANTSLGGHFPDEIIGNLKHLWYLNISQNFLSGSIPTAIGGLSLLSILDLSNNQLSGAIPKSIGKLSNLFELIIANNNLEGVLTEDHFANLKHLEFLSLSGNTVAGPITSNINGTMNQLSNLILSMNKLNGSIPFTLCTLENARMLDISMNHLSGELPNCWKKDSHYQVLDFSSNNISGGIPNSICSLNKLESLHLSNNSLSGVFPTYLRKCNHLVTLDLSHNNFYGSIPHWIGESMPELQILNLKSNKFSRYLPPQLSSLSRLHILDLSHNNLSGFIPKNFGNFNAMKLSNQMRSFGDFYEGAYYKENILLDIKGHEYKCEIILSLINLMDLSCNSLYGSIPEELTDLSGLMTLNLSGNHLTGEITNKIGRMHELESLDLSRNNISGGIPSSLGNLDSLGKLNLSYNNLSGMIPFDKHLTTFNDPSIYTGNYDLCGPPLSKNCSREKEPTTPSDDDDEEERDNIWLYLGIGCGFATGLWAIFIIMLFKGTWRVAYFRFVDNMYDRVYVAIVVKFTALKRKFQNQDHRMH